MAGNGYNCPVMRRFATCALAALLLASCSKNIENKDAVRQGVVDHLKARKNLDLDLSSMQLEVTSVIFRDKEADATVSFVPKGAAPSQGMSMKYTLVREGGSWKVKQKSETTNNPHSGGAVTNPHEGGMGTVPPPGAGGGAELPPGHPPMPSTGGGKK